MEWPPKPSVVAPALILLVHVMAAAEPAIALKVEPAGSSSHIPPLVDCAPAPPAPAARSSNLSAFRANLLALLDALPPAVAAAYAHTGGFTSDLAQSGGAVGGDRAFARASCYGSGSSPGDDCLSCLSAAAQDVADGCHGRRGGTWRAGCFLSYAGTGASTAHEDAWRGWFYDDDSDDDDDDDGTPTAACVANTTEAECSRCLSESAQVVPALKERRQLSMLHRNSVVVVGYSCYLRVPILPPTPQWLVTVECAVIGVAMGIAVIIEIGCLRFCIEIAGNQFNPAAV